MSSAAPAAAPAGLVLGRYRPLRPLGSGASGSVWLARDERNGLDVALKIVPREGKAGTRAEREAQVASRLRHERCIRAYACGGDDGHVYVAYEYVPGRTLRDALRSGQLRDAQAVEAGAQMLEGLAHAHARGVVHRDVKPANVLLADGDEVSVRLLDFGLAQVEQAETLTAVGDVPGTLAYIPPERLAGKESGPAADVWAVGVVLWEALAGVHPFWSSSVLDTARAIETGAPPLASARPDLPRPLLAAVDSALAPDPARRPPAARLADALRRVAEERERRRARRGRRLVPPSAWRLAGAASAGVAAGAAAGVLPFYPGGAALVFGAVTALLALVRERAALALALAVPVLPLGNVSLGLAVCYSALAAALLVLAWREPRAGLAVAAGPLLAPLGALGFLPLAAAGLVRSPLRRLGVVLAAAGAAGAVAAARGSALPLAHARAPADVSLAGSESAVAIAGRLAHALAERSALPLAALALAVAAALLPALRRRGPWGLAGAGALVLAAALAAPAAPAAPLVACAWLTCGVLALARE